MVSWPAVAMTCMSAERGDEFAVVGRVDRTEIEVGDTILDPGFQRPPLRLDVEVNLEKLALGMEPSLEGLKHTLAVLRTGTQASNALLEAKETDMGTLDKRTGLGARPEATRGLAGPPPDGSPATSLPST